MKINDEGEPFCERKIASNPNAITALDQVQNLILEYNQDKSIGEGIKKKYAQEIQQVLDM